MADLKAIDGQHQRSGHDDRRKERRHHPRRDKGIARMHLIWRVKGILADPSAEWARIEKEPSDAANLLTGYVALLALVPLVFGFIGACIVGAIVPGVGLVRAPIPDGLLSAIFGYVMSCASVLVLALLIDLLAPLFGGRRSFDRAFKLAAFSYTPVWLAGIFMLAPGLRFLGLTGLYAGFILWTGLPMLMKSSAKGVQIYAMTIIACGWALTLVAAAAQHALFDRAGV